MQLGKEAASEVRKQYPIIEDQHIAKYLTQIGNRLVAAAPTELKQSVYASLLPAHAWEVRRGGTARKQPWGRNARYGDEVTTGQNGIY